LEDVNFSPDVSPATSGKKSRLSLHDPQSPLEGSSHTSVQAGIFPCEELVIFHASNKLMKLILESESSIIF
jgi:hypothetical protein